MTDYTGPTCVLCGVKACTAEPDAKTPPGFCPMPAEGELLAEVERQRRPDVRAGIDATLARALGARGRPYLLVTGHRRENFGRPLRELCAALATLAARYSDHDIVYPVHLNPNVHDTVRAALGGARNVKLVEPLAYPEFVALMRDCRLVLTDSGGIQEEAPSLGKPVLVMREATERPEGIEAGTVRLVAPWRAAASSSWRCSRRPAVRSSSARRRSISLRTAATRCSRARHSARARSTRASACCTVWSCCPMAWSRRPAKPW